MPNPRTRPARSVRQPSDLTRGLAAGIALLILVVGVPVLLAGTIGWPLPHSLPTLAEIRSALAGTRIPDEAILKGLAICAWAYWLHLIWCLIVETLAAARGRLPRRVPLGGLNQAIASRLVAALLLLGPTSMSVRPTAAAVVSDSPAVVQHLPAAGTLLGDRGTAAPADQPRSSPARAHEVSHPSRSAVVGADGHRGDQRQPSPSTSPTYTVRRGDTLWGIAERELGDPLRWRELERLNRGRPQPDGDRLQDPDLIRPGWRLLLPANRSIPQAHGQQPGEHHRQGADTPVEPRGGTSPTTGPATTLAPTSTTAAPTTEAPTSTNPPPTLQPTKPHRPPGAIAPIAAALGVGLLAAGVLAVLARLRRIQQRHVSRGRRIRLPTGTAADVERAMRATAEPEATAFFDLALRVLAGVIRRDGLPVPAIQAALLSETALEFLLASPAADAPAPFVTTDDGRRWMLPRDRSLDDFAVIAADAIPPLPALVTIGQTEPDPPVRLLVNLEAAGLLAVPGPADRAAALCNAVAAELATSSWSGFFDLVLVGDFGAELAPLERVQQAPSLEAVLPRLQRRVAEATTTLEELGSSTALEGRILHTASDSLVPTVVICAEPPSPETLQRLAALLQQTPPKQPPFAVLIAGDVPQARWQLRIDGERARLDPLGVDFQPQQLRPAELAAIGELLRTAADTGGVPADAPPYDQLHTPTPADTLGPAAPTARTTEHQPTTDDNAEAADTQTDHHRTTEPGTVEVAILGKIELRGVPKIERAKAIEAIVYLAMHPDGVDAERLWEALWPDKPVNRGTFHTTITAARSGLGDAPDGTRYMRNPHEGIYRLHPAVQLDWASFQTLVEQGRSAGPEGKALLRQALELVRGLPLETTAPRSYSWAVVHRTEIESAIAEAAQDLGDLCLADNDPTGATWAARRGLLASPYDERLYRILMRAAHTVGNPAGVDTVLRELLHVLDAEDDPVDELHPLTVDLYRKLRPRRSILAQVNANHH